MSEDVEFTTVFSTEAGRFAGVIAAEMPDIGFFNHKKRLVAFVCIAAGLEQYRLDGGDFRLSISILMIISNPARKAVREGILNREQLRSSDLVSQAGRFILGI